MKITYINHSGFLVEADDCYYIFDYYKGDLSALDKSKGVIMLSAQKNRLILWAISTMFISYDV